MATSAEQIRKYAGPALFSYGFRPFFLFGSMWAAVALILFVCTLSGSIVLPSAFPPVTWHAHEMIFGYVPAIIAGFLLTAVPNWTGRLPVVGAPLAMLFSVWVAGRLAVLFSGSLGERGAAAIDLAFLILLAAVVAREVLAAGNTRNLKVLVVIGLLAIGNAVSHGELIAGSGEGYGVRLGLAAAIILITLIGGRIIPSFSRNWLVKQKSAALPKPFDRFDVVVTVVTAIALLAWVAAPETKPTAVACLAAMVGNAWRLLRWSGWRTAEEPLVVVLHVAFAFVPIGFGLVALAALAPRLLMLSGAIHAWTAGAIGLMTLAVMTRASLGHTGQALTANWKTTTLYLAVVGAAGARIAQAFGIMPDTLLIVSAVAWVIGFAGFAVVYGPLLIRRRA